MNTLQWKTHTPEGALDILEKDCFIKSRVEGTIKDVFQSYGYFEIQSPTFEFYDVFSDENQTSLIKFFDQQGRILVLRPDITTPIARIAATKFDNLLPRRVCYVGRAFSNGDAHAGALQKEFTQAGVELLGNTSPEADAEVIAVTIRVLLEAGLKEFQIDIGQAEFFKGIMEQTGLSPQDVEKMRELIDRKSFVGIQELVNGYSIDQDLKRLILEIPNLFGDVAIIDSLKGYKLCQRAKDAVENLLQVYQILVDYGYEKYISIDLGMVQGLNYYTGVIIKGFTRGVGFPICGGGRYDNLIGEFGKQVSATGVAIGIERLISALHQNGVQFDEPQVNTLVCSQGNRSGAIRVADGLRSSGLCVEMWLGGDGAKNYAKQKNIGGIVTVKEDNTIEIYNVADGTAVTTDISSFLMEGEQA